LTPQLSGSILAAMDAFKLEELARAADVAPRTIRYYVQRGLLPAPEFRGKDTTYGAEHLRRLRAIKRMQEARVPLEEIAARLGAGREDAPPPAAREVAAPSVPIQGERWARLPIAPGLDLHLADDAAPEVRRLAREILTQHGTPRKT
jgi:DNA-binding transcriptional MerR regulator